jgi:hypothetical protein
MKSRAIASLFKCIGCFLLVGLLSPNVDAKVTFEFTYFDVVNDTDIGFDDPTLGADRRAALEATATAMGNRIGQTATVEFGLAPSLMDGTGGPIGIAAANFLDTTPGIRDGEVYRRTELGISDPTPGDINNLDGGAIFDFGYSVDLTGPSTPGNAYFPDVVRHELTHALGYGSFLRADQTGFNGSSPLDMYTRFDSMLKTDAGPGTGLAIIDASGAQLLDSATFDVAFGSGLVFDGPAARAANGGLPVKLFGFDPTHSAAASDVMFPSPAVGFVRDDWAPADVGVLRDLGYAIIPEPGSGLLAAFSLIAFLASSRNR